MNNQTVDLQQFTQLTESLDSMWISMSTYLVFLMQAGFAFLEAGSVREKNVQNILIKNMLDICGCTVVWWLVGYAFAYGDSAGLFIGSSKFATADFEGTTEYRDWLFQWAFAGTAATIVSGSLAERTHILAYISYALFITTFIYPIIVHWTWGGGWLADQGYLDFAGSGIVHLVGGVAGIVGSYIVGARLGRFDPNRSQEFKPHNVPMVVLGTLLLWFGWYGFNCGSTLSATSDNSVLISKIGVNTTLAAATAGLVCFANHAINNINKRNMYNISPLTNGILAGLVSITAACNNVAPFSAFIIGIIGGLVYTFFSNLLVKFKIDDPLDAFPVHAGCGIWGVIAVGLFDQSSGLFYGHGFKQLGVQLLAILCISLWTAILSALVFLLLKKYQILRISQAEEEQGMDRAEHGGTAYHFNVADINDDPSPTRVSPNEENEQPQQTIDNEQPQQTTETSADTIHTVVN